MNKIGNALIWTGMVLFGTGLGLVIVGTIWIFNYICMF